MSTDRTQKVIQRAATGALLGLGIGALTGNAGRGAGIGAIAGAASGLFGGEKGKLDLEGGAPKKLKKSKKSKKSKKGGMAGVLARRSISRKKALKSSLRN